MKTAADELRELAQNGTIVCGKAFAFAGKHAIDDAAMKALLHDTGIRLKDCEQACLSRRCEHYEERLTTSG